MIDSETQNFFKSLGIESLDSLHDLTARQFAETFGLRKLSVLANNLRAFLWRNNILPDRLKELEGYELPVEVLGISQHNQVAIKTKRINTVSEFVRRDAVEKLTESWSEKERLGVRVRIFCLLLLPNSKLEKLKSALPLLNGRPNTSVLKTVSNIQLSPLEDDFENDWFIHAPWLAEKLPDDFVSSAPAIERFLFEDVYKLPIVTSRRHEIWAGAQMKCAERLKEIVDEIPNSSTYDVFSKVYAILLEKWESLIDLCEQHQLSLPSASAWSNEVLAVRKDFFNTPRSRFRGFLKRIEKLECAEEETELMIDTACTVFEMFWMLPSASLGFIREQSRGIIGKLSSPDSFGEFLATMTGLDPILEVRLKQGKVARSRLITGYFRMVLRFCRNFAEKEDALDYFMDLVQEGAIGLITAADKYDYRRLDRFITYATSWIWQSTSRNLPDLIRNIRVPVHYNEKLKKLESIYVDLLENEGIAPIPEILCLYLDFLEADEISQIRIHIANGKKLSPHLQEKWLRAIEKTVRLLKNIEPTISLEAEMPSETYSYQALTGALFEPILLQDLLVDVHENSYAYDKLIMLKELRLVLDNYLSVYSERDQKMIDLRFGLTDGNERTLEEIGQEFGVTRERVRQITAKVLKRLASRKEVLEQYSTLSNTPPDEPLLSKQVSEFLVEKYSYWTKYHHPDKGNDTNEYWQWLDELVDKLPGSDWHQRSSTSSRRMQIEDALEILGTPAHHTDITEQLNDMIADDLDDSYIYNLLNKYEDSFILLGEGVFSRVQWESARRKEPLPLLPFCSSPLPDLPGQADTFFESVLVAKSCLKHPMRASQFLEEMLTWSHNDLEQSNWYRQSILNSYYLVGLIPYTFHFNGADPLLEDAGPTSDDLQFLRRHCLVQLTERLAAMPQFWWVLRRYQPGRITDFAEPFVDIHPLGLDDVANRLKLLAGLGAVRRLSYGKYQLSSLGEEMVTQLMQQPVFGDVSDEAESEVDMEEFDLFGLGLW